MKRILFVLALGLPVLSLAFAGCGGAGAGVGQAEAQKESALLANAMEALNDDRPSIGLFVSALKQLDNYITLTKKPASEFKLTKDEEDLIGGQLLRGLIREGQPNDPTTRASRLADLQRSSFTFADAFHIDSCDLFSDAAQALRDYYVGDEPHTDKAAIPAYQLELARQAFDWVMRQVQLQQAPPGLDPWPPQSILRRGTGDAEERARVFLALLQQLKLDGCMVPRTVEVIVDDKREPRELPWAPGVLIGSDVYLFEPRFGKPIPSADGKGVATLRELLKNPDILKKLYAGDADPVTPAQLEHPAVLIPTSLPALAPRMRMLQTWLGDANINTVVYQDLLATQKRFEKADLGFEPRLWTNRAGLPALILQRHIENPRNELRFQEIIVPRNALVPAWFHQLTSKVSPELKRQLFQHFDNLFLSVRIQPVSTEEVEVRREGAPTIPGISNQPERVQRRKGGVRDLLVRGRPEQAVDRVLDMELRLQKMMEVFRGEVEAFQGYQEAELRNKWAKELLGAQARFSELMVLRQGLQDKSQLEGLNEELRKAALILDGKIQEQDMNLRYLSAEWALPDISEHLTYFMALAKMELAIRAEVQARLHKANPAANVLTPAQQWQSAADWFERYEAQILGNPRQHWARSAAAHLATCREALARLEQKK
jgi:hypothetical protein